MKKMNTLTIISLALIFLGGVGGILLTVAQLRSSEADKSEIINTAKTENEDLRNRLNEINNERDKLNVTLQIRDEKIQEQNDEIKSLSNRLIEKSEYIEKYVTGNNNYPHLEMAIVKGVGNDDKFIFSVENSFDYPVYNILIQAFDYDKISETAFGAGKKKSIKMLDLSNALFFEYKTNEIAPKQHVIPSGQFEVRDAKILVKIHAGSRVVFQKIVIIIHEPSVYFANCILDINGTMLKESFPDGIPDKIKTEIRLKFREIPYDGLDLVYTR